MKGTGIIRHLQVDVEVSRLVPCQFQWKMPCNASVFGDVVSIVYFECGNNFSNRSVVSVGTSLTINRVKPTTVLVCL